MFDFDDKDAECDAEYPEDIEELIQRFKEAIEELKQQAIYQDFEKLAAEKFFERDPIPETPYIFRNQSRVYDKRPHKQHRCRNNC